MSVTSSEASFEQFVAETFDSEEAVMIVSALRDASSALTPGEVLDRLERDFGLESDGARRLAEKRVELRLRDLVRHGVAEMAGESFRYRGDEAGVGPFVEQAVAQLSRDRAQLNRLIYSTSARARRLAEAFRF